MKPNWNSHKFLTLGCVISIFMGVSYVKAEKANAFVVSVKYT